MTIFKNKLFYNNVLKLLQVINPFIDYSTILNPIMTYIIYKFDMNIIFKIIQYFYYTSLQFKQQLFYYLIVIIKNYILESISLKNTLIFLLKLFANLCFVMFFWLIINFFKALVMFIPSIFIHILTFKKQQLHDNLTLSTTISKSTLNIHSQNCKKRTNFKRFTQTNLVILKDFFDHCQYPTTEEKMKLSIETNLTYKQISNWFSNSRKLIQTNT